MAVTADIETRNSTVPMEYNPKNQDQVQLTTLSAFSQFYGIWLGRILPLNKYVHNIIAGEKSDERGGGEEERQDDTLLLLPYQVWYGWRKVCLEFMKRSDPDLITQVPTPGIMKQKCPILTDQ